MINFKILPLTMCHEKREGFTAIKELVYALHRAGCLAYVHSCNDRITFLRMLLSSL